MQSSGLTSDYERDGFVFPITVFDAGEAARMRQQLEIIEQTKFAACPSENVGKLLRVNAHYLFPLVYDAASDARVLNAVESLIGPNILIYSAEFFIKEPATTKHVSWHQDLTYWGLGETDDEVTAWIALSDVTTQAGCMRFIPGSHNRAIQPHTDTFAADNQLSRGQELAVEIDESIAVSAVLKPGQMSLHHGRLFHASGPNRSSDRRIGLAIRYVTPEVRQQVAGEDYAILVRGTDHSGNWIHVSSPKDNVDPNDLQRYRRIRDIQKIALAQGLSNPASMYKGS
ncbi:MAG: phytanoyl-CoA dioxygenase family protein [Pseudomonadota bacterium]